MLRIARKKFPYAAIEIYNHFYMMKPSICEVILKEKLVDSVFTNIDGIEDSYEKVKKINFNTTMSNLCYFIEERDSMNLLIPVTVKALTLRHYIDVVKTNFNTFPAYVSKELLKVSDDFLLIKKMFDKVLNKKMDKLIRSWVCMWGERENLSKEKQDRYACPMLFRNEREIFVAPDGRWYLCCMDSRQELVIGDLTKSKVCELVLSKKRSQMLKMLKKRDFTAIGGPCKTVECCHIYNRKPLISRIIRIIMNQSISQKILSKSFFHNLTRKN